MRGDIVQKYFYANWEYSLSNPKCEIMEIITFKSDVFDGATSGISTFKRLFSKWFGMMGNILSKVFISDRAAENMELKEYIQKVREVFLRKHLKHVSTHGRSFQCFHSSPKA